jgi:hypothetical protein
MTVVADQGTHLLITDGTHYAVIERRSNSFYNCHDRTREGIPADDLSRVAAILDADDWTDQETAQATFDKIAARGTELAQRML